MERRNTNCDKCNIKLKGNGAYSLNYLGKTYWLCGHCMHGIVKREIKTSEDSFVVPVCEEDVVEITGEGLLEHRDICRKEGALEELDAIREDFENYNNAGINLYLKRRITIIKEELKELK